MSKIHFIKTVSPLTIYMLLAFNFDYSQTLLGTCGLGYRCLTMPCSLHKNAWHWEPEREKKKKLNFKKKLPSLSIFFFFNYYKLLSKLSAVKSLNSNWICRVTIGAGKSLDNDS